MQAATIALPSLEYGAGPSQFGGAEFRSAQMERAKLDVVVREHRILADGELDLTTVPALRTALYGLASAATETVVVDLTRVFFIDSAGLSVLLGTCRRLADRALRLHVLVSQGRQVARVLTQGGFDQVMTIDCV